MPIRAALDLQNCDACLKVRRRDVDLDAALEARAQPLLQRLQRLGRPVAAHHHLLAIGLEMVEGMEDLLLSALLAGNKLDIVDQEHVQFAVLVAELLGALPANGADQVICKLLGGAVEHAVASGRSVLPMACSRWVLPNPTPP